MSSLMEIYESLSEAERECVESALDTLTDECRERGIRLCMSDGAARAANALARYIVESRL